MTKLLSKFRSIFISAAGLFLWTVLLGASMETRAQETQSVWQVIQGKWEVTRLTGSTTIKPLDTNPSWCEKGEVTVYPVVDKEETFIRFTNSINTHYQTAMPAREDLDTLELLGNISDTDMEGLFVFQFGFDNGHHSNSVLEARTVPFEYIEMLKGLWSAAVGFWGTKSVGSGILIHGRSVTGTKWGGLGDFQVSGKLVNKNRIEGKWEWEEKTAGPFPKMECRTVSKGSGTWVAEKN